MSKNDSRLFDNKMHTVAVQIISARFPPKASQRTKRLLGMILEANGELDDAETLYKGMLELNKANALAYKRLICVALARGDAEDAVRQLNEYVKNFTGDHSAVRTAACI